MLNVFGVKIPTLENLGDFIRVLKLNGLLNAL